MHTWTLLVVLMAVPDGQPRGITSVSGYASEGECHSAGLEASQMARVATRIEFRCIPGPKR